jgi:ATP-dependent protease Clp ATPase subunit
MSQKTINKKPLEALPKRKVEQVSTPKTLIDELDRILIEMQEAQKGLVISIEGKDQKMNVPQNRNDLINFILWSYVQYWKEMKETESRIILPGQ